MTSALDTVVGGGDHQAAGIGCRTGSIPHSCSSAHDLSTVASFANRIVVLYAGRVAEQGPTQRISPRRTTRTRGCC